MAPWKTTVMTFDLRRHFRTRPRPFSPTLFFAFWHIFFSESWHFGTPHTMIYDILQGFPRYAGHFFFGMNNRIEHQKLSHMAADLPPGWVSGVQLGLRQTQARIKTKTIRRGKIQTAILILSSNVLLNSNIAGANFPFLIVWVLISACVCRWPS